MSIYNGTDTIKTGLRFGGGGGGILVYGKGPPSENDGQGEEFGGEGYDISCLNSTVTFIGGLPGIILVEVGK